MQLHPVDGNSGNASHHIELRLSDKTRAERTGHRQRKILCRKPPGYVRTMDGRGIAGIGNSWRIISENRDYLTDNGEWSNGTTAVRMEGRRKEEKSDNRLRRWKEEWENDRKRVEERAKEQMRERR